MGGGAVSYSSSFVIQTCPSADRMPVTFPVSLRCSMSAMTEESLLMLSFQFSRPMLNRSCRLSQYSSNPLPALILIFCLLEYALWTASCFWDEEILFHPYYWFDFMLTASFPLILHAVRKAMAA